MITKKKILLFLALAAIPALASAATLNIAASSPVVVGQSFRVDVALDTQNDDVNAIQGELLFPPDLFTFEGINDGGSPISLWVEAPHEISPGTVAFSGVIPGGFAGSAGSVVGIMLVPKASGAGTVNIQNAELLRNDGQGSPVIFTTTGQTIAVTAAPAASSTIPAGPSTPFTVPGNFTPTIARDPNVYDGKYFLVFSATDKGSGIDHYDVVEVPAGVAIGQDPAWTTATSPYLLKDQALSSDIYVRAVNNGGSATIAKVPARFPRSAAPNIAYLISAFLILLLALGADLFFVLHKKRRRHIEL